MSGRGGESWIGRVLANRYRLIAQLGEGAIADVFLARHVLIDRLSAIKVLRPFASSDPALRALFLREARAVNRINHPNIVEISDYGETDEVAFLVMEYVAGEPLSRVLGRGPLGHRRAAHAGLQLALALSRAHEMGVVHRDVKPDNVIVVPRKGGLDQIKLTDFGFAKVLGSAHDTGRSPQFLPSRLSAGYVAPEYVALGTMDARSDLFSLGVVVYEAATGALPYAPERPAHEQSTPTRPSDVDPRIPARFDDIVLTLLAPEPDDRPRDAFELVAMLRSLLETPEGDAAPRSGAPRPPSEAGPRLVSLSFDRIETVCITAWERIREAAEGEVRPGLRDDLRRADELLAMLRRLGALVAEDTRALTGLEERARRLRADYGQRLDRLSLERSKLLGWAGTIADRSDWVRTQRLSGSLSGGKVDAMLWEQAALDREEERARTTVDGVDAEIASIQSELEEQEEGLEQALAVTNATLEGHVAALRSLAAETWVALEDAAARVDLDLTVGG